MKHDLKELLEAHVLDTDQVCHLAGFAIELLDLVNNRAELEIQWGPKSQHRVAIEKILLELGECSANGEVNSESV